MAVRIRLMRMGKIRNPQYRIVVADAHKKRDGRAIETLGIYHPKEEPSRIELDSERVQYWLSVGAQPSEPVRAILRKTGDWQKFKGLTPPSRPLKVAPPRADREEVFQAEAKAAAGLAETAKKEKGAKADKGAKAEKADKGAKAEKTEKAGKSDKAGRGDAAAKAGDAEPAKAQEGADKPARKTARRSKPKADEAAAGEAGAGTGTAEAGSQPDAAAQAAASSEEQAGAQSGEQA